MPGRNRDDDSGQYSSAYQPEDFVDALGELGGSAGTRDVADEVGCHRDTARRRLLSLVEEGRVAKSTVGDAALWTLTDDG
ncbi:MerR family transcriptional regulator [Halorubrum sp. C3]|nr:MerR family transcriptional regulator [Halorubrum sp. C3]